MLISFIIISIIAISGLALTYLFSEKGTFLWRLAAGNIIGSAVFGLAGFLIADSFGLSVTSVFVSVIVSAIPVLTFLKPDKRLRLKSDWQRAKDRMQGISTGKVFSLLFYLFFIVLFAAFFDRAMMVSPEGIFTGASQNLGDLPYHLGAILGFTEGNNFPPQNPSFAGAKFTYPFIADFLSACLVQLGTEVRSAMFLQNVCWSVSLLIVLEDFVLKITRSRSASRIAPLLLFFSGGLGFLWFFKDIAASGFAETIWNLPRDYTIGDNFRWGNSLITLFVTQRSLLLGMPLTIIVLGYLWKLTAAGRERTYDPDKVETRKHGGRTKARREVRVDGVPDAVSMLIVGLIAGMLPLIHAHSLIVLFVVSVCLLLFSTRYWKQWIAFAAGVSIVAIPELIWILAGTATDTREFIGWHFGWDARGTNIFWFWLKNTGLFIPLLLAAVLLVMLGRNDKISDETGFKTALSESGTISTRALIFFLPFVFIFVVGNVLKLAPWEWDNVKVLIYSFVGGVPIVALVLAAIWDRGGKNMIFSGALILGLTLSGGLDVWRVASAQIRYQVFDRDAVEISEQIKNQAAPDALFLNAPTYNSAVVLTGRRSLMRYLGHLSSHGIDYAGRESDLKKIYSGTATADILLGKYGIDYVLISPAERNSLQVNEEYFQKYKIIAETGEYKVYKVR